MSAAVRRLLCRWRGHRWVAGVSYDPKFHVCTRCGEPGFWVES